MALPSDKITDDFLIIDDINSMLAFEKTHAHTGADESVKIALSNTTGTLPANTVDQAAMADSAIGQAELKIGTSESTVTSTTPITITITTAYAFGYLLKNSSAVATFYLDESYVTSNLPYTAANPGTSYIREFAMKSNGATTASFKYLYVTASPPYALIGADDWGLWAWLLRDKITGKIEATNVQDDPSWEMIDGCTMPKMHPAKMMLRTSPWHGRVPEGMEVVLLDLRHLNGFIQVDHPATVALEALKAQRDKWIIEGHRAEDLDRFENEATERASGAEKVFTTKRAMLRKYCSEKGMALMDLLDESTADVMTTRAALISELKESIEATEELRKKDRAEIPNAFKRANIKILRCPSRAL